MSDVVKNQITKICDILQSAAQQTRVLTHLGWPGRVRDDFLASDAKKLPRVSYADFNAKPVLELVAEARRLIRAAQFDRDTGISGWLDRQATSIETSARMLLACGTKEFFTHSRALYGAPGDVLIDQTITALTLAGDFEDALAQFDGFNEKYLVQTSVDSGELAAKIEIAVQQLFGDDAPVVMVVTCMGK